MTPPHRHMVTSMARTPGRRYDPLHEPHWAIWFAGHWYDSPHGWGLYRDLRRHPYEPYHQSLYPISSGISGSPDRSQAP